MTDQPGPAPNPDADPVTWQLRLYVNGASPHSVAAVENVRRICDEDLRGQVDLQVLDIRAETEQVQQDNVYVAPTLVKRWPAPVRRVVGDLSDADRLRHALNLVAEEPDPPRASAGER